METDCYLVIGGHIVDLLLKRGEEDLAAFRPSQVDCIPRIIRSASFVSPFAH